MRIFVVSEKLTFAPVNTKHIYHNINNKSNNINNSYIIY